MEGMDLKTAEATAGGYALGTSRSIDAAQINISEKEVARINRKIDFRLLPVLSILYLMSYLDRGNMGNAAIIGIKTDLNLTPNQYNLCLTIFFIPYALFEVPSNLVLKVLKPNVWIPIMMVAWGVIATLMGIVQNFNGLFAARFFIGMAEAGFFPAATYLLTQWYRRRDLQLRMGIFYGAGALSGAFSGLLAYLIDKMDGIAGLEGWRWLFILEGILTVVIGVICPFFLPNDPNSCKFLTQEEKHVVDYSLRYDVGTSRGSYNLEEGFRWSHIWAAVKDWKIYAMIVIYWASSISLYGFTYTLPTVIKELGYSAGIAQLMTIPIYCAAVVALLLVAYLSDRAQSRSTYVIGPLIVAGIGLIIVMAIPKGRYPGALYAMLFFIAMGLYSIICGSIAWTGNNLAGPWKRAVGMALMISIGNLGGAVGTNIFLAREAPYYWTGYGVSLGVVVLSLVTAIFMRWKLQRINAAREALTSEEISSRHTEQELATLGDDSPLFRYIE